MRTRGGWLIALALLAPAPALAQSGPALNVDVGAARHAISPDIYGMNFADPALADEIGLPVDRWGGNRFEMHDFSTGNLNLANDYYFENKESCGYFDTTCAPGQEFWQVFVQRDEARGTTPLMQLPLAGYVSKDASSCGFPKTRYAAQDSFDPFDANCGNGQNGGANLVAHPTDDGVAITTPMQQAWVSALSAAGSHLYELGNEPALWSDTHRDIHPAAETYDELRDKTVALATAVKNGDPQAQTIGFSEWGWPNYFCSAADNINTGCYEGNNSNVDRKAHGWTPLVNWFLQQLKAAGAAAGKRLLDDIDVHYYPAGRDVSDPMNVTRSLWDPTYVDPSYIDTAIRLIPRMKEWVAADYPGTKVSLTEYDLLDPSLTARQNTIVEADTLGIFGREGLDLATFFDEGYGGASYQYSGTAVSSPVANAFRMFRNYDGSHDGFGETSVGATSADQSRLAVYAAQRTDGALTVLVLNKTAGALSAPLTIAGGPANPQAEVYQWTGGAQGSIHRLADTALTGQALSFPEQSMTLLVVRAGQAPVTTTTTTTTTTTAPPTTTTPVTTTATTSTTTAMHTTPPLCTLPKVLAATKARALTKLRRPGCTFTVKVRRRHASRRQRGRVLKVSPAAGQMLAPGAVVTITIGT